MPPSTFARPALTGPFVPNPLAVLAAVALAGLLGGCDLFGDGGSSKSFIARPDTIRTERDAFLQANERQYGWIDEVVRSGRPDTLVGFITAKLRSTRDTVIGGEPRPYFDVSASFNDSQPAPAAFFARLGFSPASIAFDAGRVPDPGASLRFPVLPVKGWRLDTIIGETRFVRVLTGTAQLEAAGVRYETWAFAESTWWDDHLAVPVGTGTTWIGRYGLVKHVSLWPAYVLAGPGGTQTGTLRRTVQAQ
jgi:hypothetical protein